VRSCLIYLLISQTISLLALDGKLLAAVETLKAPNQLGNNEACPEENVGGATGKHSPTN
jgi:hypothetical protein